MDLTNYLPLDANVWGTVSDWVMVGVTSLTAWYLYKTFQSQLAVQKLQQTTADIEANRHRIEVLPFFLLTTTETEGLSNNPDHNIAVFIRFEFKLRENTCTDLVLNLWTHPSGFAIINDLPIRHTFVNANTDLGLFGKFSTQTFEESDHEWGCHIYFELKYTDILKNEYSQMIGYSLINNECLVDNQDPILIPKTPRN